MTIYFLKFPLQTSLGGGEIYTLALAKHYQQLGHEVRLFTSDALLFRLFEKHDLPRKRLFFGWEPTAKWSLLLWPLTYLIARHKLKKILKIHTGQTGSIEHICHGLTEKLILTPMVAKTIWIEHKIPGRWLKWSPLKFRYLKLAKQAKLVTVSEFAKSEFIKLGVPEKNIQVIYPSPTSLPWHGEGLREGSQNFTIGILGRLDPEKGIIEFLRSVIPALGRNPSWKILIAGEGPEKNQIQHNQISYLGFIYDLDEFFSQISVLAYPSTTPASVPPPRTGPNSLF